MARRYEVVFEQVAVTAPQDLVQVSGATGKMLRIIRQWWKCTDTALPTAQQLATRGRFLPATVTAGNGTAATPQKTDNGDAAATFTALINSTTKATTTGTPQLQDEGGDHLYAGYDFMFPAPPTVAVGQAFVFELLSTPSATVHLSGGVLVEEIG